MADITLQISLSGYHSPMSLPGCAYSEVTPDFTFMGVTVDWRVTDITKRISLDRYPFPDVTRTSLDRYPFPDVTPADVTF